MICNQQIQMLKNCRKENSFLFSYRKKIANSEMIFVVKIELISLRDKLFSDNPEKCGIGAKATAEAAVYACIKINSSNSDDGNGNASGQHCRHRHRRL